MYKRGLAVNSVNVLKCFITCGLKLTLGCTINKSDRASAWVGLSSLWFVVSAVVVVVVVVVVVQHPWTRW